MVSLCNLNMELRGKDSFNKLYLIDYLQITCEHLRESDLIE